VRVSELSEAAEVPVPTIKYYLREGLLFPGIPTAPNQAEYEDEHIRRLRLIRTLRDVGDLGIAQIRDVLAAIDDESLPMHDMLGVAHHALGPAGDEGSVTEDVAKARSDVDTFIRELGWRVSANAPARRSLAEALVALRRLGWSEDTEGFVPYAKAAQAIAAHELGRRRLDATRSESVEWMVIGTVVFEAVLAALRRLAEEHESAKRQGGRRPRRGR
jgi:DNA-binding transcriptional MerR regulator